MLRPAVKVSGVGAPITFEPNSSHTAHIVLGNPTIKPWTYDVEVYGDWVGAGICSWSCTVPAKGSSLAEDCPFTMPETECTVHLYATVKVAGDDIFNEIIDTIIVEMPVPPDVDVTLTWD